MTELSAKLEPQEDLPTFLRWVAESYEAMATAAESAEEYDALTGSAEMARAHITALASQALRTTEAEWREIRQDAQPMLKDGYTGVAMVSAGVWLVRGQPLAGTALKAQEGK